MRFGFVVLLTGIFGCQAVFSDLRPEGGSDSGPALDVAAPDAANDAVTSDTNAGDSNVQGDAQGDTQGDTGSSLDAMGSDDTSVPEDTGVTSDAGPSTPTLIGEGTFEGRGGYEAAGSVRVERIGVGEFQVVLSGDFSSAAVPGPIIVITPRADIGNALISGDILVASLSADQISGAGTFPFSAAAVPDGAYVFIYCEPFGVETARAATVAP